MRGAARRPQVRRSPATLNLRPRAATKQMGGREKESLLATALEAVLAVVYLEGGLEAARRAVASLALW